MTPFNLDEYEPVEQRLDRFWRDHPNGRVRTEILARSDLGEFVDGTKIHESIVMLAEVYLTMTDKYPAATGHAQETAGEGMVNKTSWVENCETSAIGRALANLNYAPKGTRPSREEMRKMSKAPRTRPSSPSKVGARSKPRASHIALLTTAKDAKVDDELRHRIIRMLTGGRTQSVKDLDDEQADMITAQLVWFRDNRTACLEQLVEWEAAHP